MDPQRARGESPPVPLTRLCRLPRSRGKCLSPSANLPRGDPICHGNVAASPAGVGGWARGAAGRDAEEYWSPSCDRSSPARPRRARTGHRRDPRRRAPPGRSRHGDGRRRGRLVAGRARRRHARRAPPRTGPGALRRGGHADSQAPSGAASTCDEHSAYDPEMSVRSDRMVPWDRPRSRVRAADARRRAPAPRLDDDQQAVVDHPGGPLLVLAGPGTGKTTTLVEAVVERVERHGHDPRADPRAHLQPQGRRRAARPHRRPAGPHGRARRSAITFHSFCYALVRELQDPESYCRRRCGCCPAPSRTSRSASCVAGGPRTGRSRGRRGSAAALPTRGFADEVRGLLAAPASARPRPRRPRRGRAARAARTGGGGRFFDEYLDVLDTQASSTTPSWCTAPCCSLGDPACRPALRERYDVVFVDEYQDTDPAQVRLLHALAGDGARPGRRR